MKVSVAIITYNRHQALARCLDSLKKQTVAPEEIVVVDSSTNDDTENLIKKTDIVYRRLRERTYQPRARNMALQMARGDIIAFLDDDTVCVPEWLENIKLGYSFSGVTGVGGPALLSDEHLNPLVRIRKTDRNQNYFTRSGEIRLLSHWIPARPVRTKQFIGANMSFLKEALLQVGGFDEFYGRHTACREEADPQIALIRSGHHFMYMPKALVYHLSFRTGGTRADSQSDYSYWYAANHKYLTDKYFSKWLSRLSWIFWSVDPPCLWMCLLSAAYHRRSSPLQWVKGLWL